MADEQGEWVCPVCARKVADPSARFCDVDGARLERAESPQSPVPMAPAASPGQRPPMWKRLLRVETLLILLGLGLIGLSIALMTPPSPDAQPARQVARGQPAEKGNTPSAPAGKKETNKSPSASAGKGEVDNSPLGRLLQECYGGRPETPRSAAKGPEGQAYDQAKKDMKAGMDMVVGATTPELTREEQARIGDDTVKELRRGTGDSRNEEQRARLARITQRLTALASRNRELGYRFDLLADANINAFMGAGGRGVVMQGLLDALSDDGGVAWVIGHELAHAELHHIDNVLRTGMAGRRLGEMIGGQDGKDMGEWMSALVTRILSSTYDQDQEFEADMVGLCLMKKAGYSPNSALQALDTMEEKNPGLRAPDRGAVRIAYDILVTHPPAKDRRRYLSELIDMMSR